MRNGRRLASPRAIAALVILVVQLASAPLAFAQQSPCGENTGDTSCAVTDGSSSSAGDPGSAPGPRQPSALVANPINLITGNKYQRETDFQSPSTHLAWQRHYNSANAMYDFGLGRGWSATFLAGLQTRNANGASLVQSNGRRILFGPAKSVLNAEGEPVYTWHAHMPTDGILQTDGDQTVWSLPDGRTLRFTGRLLVEIDYPGAAFLTLYYRNQRLASVTDELGQQLQFEYYPPVTELRRYSEDIEEIEEEHQFGSAAARLKSLRLPDGSTIDYDYDRNGNLTRAHFADGTSRLYHYEHPDLTSHLTGLTDRREERVATWAYNDEGYAIRSERAGGVERTDLAYQLPTFIGGIGSTTVTNSLGEQSVYTWQRYAEQGHAVLLQTEGAPCRRCPPVGMTYTYTDDFQLTNATHNSGMATRWEYDNHGRTTAIYKIAPDATERLLQAFTYEDNNVARFPRSVLYTSLSRPASIRYPSINPTGNHEIKFTYNEDGLPIVITEHGFSLDMVADPSTLINSQSPKEYVPIERSTSIEYADGRVTRIDGPRTDVIDVVQFRYHNSLDVIGESTNRADHSLKNSHGRLAEVLLPTGETLRILKYNADGQATLIAHGDGNPYQLEYVDGLLITLSHRGNTMRFDYDREGRTIAFTDPNGRRTSVDYDVAGRLSRVTDDLGRELQWLHDSESRKTEKRLFGMNGEEILNLRLFYDALGQLTGQEERRTNYTTGALTSQLTEFNYDSAGNIVTASNSETSQRVDYQWNPFGEMLNVASPFVDVTDNGYDNLSVNTSFNYGDKGQIFAITDARDNKSIFVRDDFGRTIVQHNPDTGTTHYKHDAAGNITSKTNAAGDTTVYSYDSANRVVMQSNRDGVSTLTYHSTNGQLIEVANPSTTENFEYNDDSQLVFHSREIDGKHYTTRYEYDQRGRVSRKELPDGIRLRYHYYPSQSKGGAPSNAGNLRAITTESFFGLVQETLVGEIDLDARDGRTRHINHNGSVTENRFHPDGSISSIEVSEGLKLSYEFDDAGRITAINKNGTLSNYNYLNSFLTRAITSTGSYSYRYDAVGNRIEEKFEDNLGAIREREFIYPEIGGGNRLLGTSQANNKTSYRYDETGSVLVGDRYRYEYNTEQRPVRVYDGDILVAKYSYNTFGERIKKVVYKEHTSRVTYFLYDGSQLSAEIESNERGVGPENYKQTVYLAHTPVAYLVGDKTYTVQSDHLGTPHRVTDTDNQTVWAANYTPFGEATVTTQSIEFGHRFPGQFFDAETGVHYNYFRHYDPKLGRYLTSDPIGLMAGVNRYAYVNANPLSFLDALGLSEQTPGMPAVSDSFGSKFHAVLSVAANDLRDTHAAAATFIDTLTDNAEFFGAIAGVWALGHWLGYGQIIDLALVYGGLAIAGVEALAFTGWLLGLAWDVYNTDYRNTAALCGMGTRLANRTREFAAEVATGALTVGLGKVSGAIGRLRNWGQR